MKLCSAAAADSTSLSVAKDLELEAYELQVREGLVWQLEKSDQPRGVRFDDSPPWKVFRPCGFLLEAIATAMTFAEAAWALLGNILHTYI